MRARYWRQYCGVAPTALCPDCAGAPPGPVDNPESSQPTGCRVGQESAVGGRSDVRTHADRLADRGRAPGSLFTSRGGWAMSARQTLSVVVEARWMVWQRRRPATGLVHPSDQGNRYRASHYQPFLDRRGVVPSMSRKGNCTTMRQWSAASVRGKTSWCRIGSFRIRPRPRSPSRSTANDCIAVSGGLKR